MSNLTINNIEDVFRNIEQKIESYPIFIESGTFCGQTILNLQTIFKHIYTIELSDKYFLDFSKIAQKYNNVYNYHGDTTNVLPKILNIIDDNSIFWLDGHWSSGDTAKGAKDCPLIEECLCIDSSYNFEYALVLIDDFRLFGTKNNEDWTNITNEKIIDCFKRLTIIQNFIYNDILVLLIKNNEFIRLKK
jgi:hypothetical protein